MHIPAGQGNCFTTTMRSFVNSLATSGAPIDALT